MKVLDLFSGIGGFSLGLERAGMTTVAFCEFDKACQKVLKKHWPDTPIYDDVRTLDGTNLQGTVDVICGGFPCQDISQAGKGAGLAGERSGLWFEFHRLIKEIKPSFAIIENVAVLRARGLDEVLRSLAEIGYDAQWHCIPAAAVGAPHLRDRIWVIAYPNPNSEGCGVKRDIVSKMFLRESKQGGEPTELCGAISDTLRKGLQRQREITCRISEELQNLSYSCGWSAEPAVGRVANGVSGRVDRIKQLGNAVVPQIPELIGRAIMESK